MSDKCNISVKAFGLRVFVLMVLEKIFVSLCIKPRCTCVCRSAASSVGLPKAASVEQKHLAV